jgi:hypothetical protein
MTGLAANTHMTQICSNATKTFLSLEGPPKNLEERFGDFQNDSFSMSQYTVLNYAHGKYCRRICKR